MPALVPSLQTASGSVRFRYSSVRILVPGCGAPQPARRKKQAVRGTSQAERNAARQGSSRQGAERTQERGVRPMGVLPRPVRLVTKSALGAQPPGPAAQPPGGAEYWREEASEELPLGGGPTVLSSDVCVAPSPSDVCAAVATSQSRSRSRRVCIPRGGCACWEERVRLLKQVKGGPAGHLRQAQPQSSRELSCHSAASRGQQERAQRRFRSFFRCEMDSEDRRRKKQGGPGGGGARRATRVTLATYRPRRPLPCTAPAAPRSTRVTRRSHACA